MILTLTVSHFTLQGVRSAMDTLKELVLQNCEGISLFCTIIISLPEPKACGRADSMPLAPPSINHSLSVNMLSICQHFQ